MPSGDVCVCADTACMVTPPCRRGRRPATRPKPSMPASPSSAVSTWMAPAASRCAGETPSSKRRRAASCHATPTRCRRTGGARSTAPAERRAAASTGEGRHTAAATRGAYAPPGGHGGKRGRLSPARSRRRQHCPPGRGVIVHAAADDANGAQDKDARRSECRGRQSGQALSSSSQLAAAASAGSSSRQQRAISGCCIICHRVSREYEPLHLS